MKFWIIAIASLLATGIILTKVDFAPVLAGTGINNAINNYKKSFDKKCGDTPTWICKGTINEANTDEQNKKLGMSCAPAQSEGCLTDYREGGRLDGKFCYSVRRPDCGKGDKEPTPTPTPSHTPTPTPSSTPTSTPTSTPSNTPTPTPTPTPTGTPGPTPTPNWCNGTCGSNYNCQGGLYCYQGFCRNPACPGESSCGCVLSATTPPQLPKTGSDDLGVIAGLSTIAGAGFYLFRRFKLI